VVVVEEAREGPAETPQDGRRDDEQPAA
jgi:hypothetical protein